MATSTDEGENPEAIHPYTMHVSSRYLDLTRRKLELTRLPRDLTLLEHRRWEYGAPKAILEPLIDFWLEHYDWRAQENIYNNTLLQFRTTISLGGLTPGGPPHSPLRVHFVHRRSVHRGAIPLLFCHGWPGSFAEVSKIIDPLCEPVSTPIQHPEDIQSFHIVAPSIPGFGFSDASEQDGFGLRATADIYDTLMRRLGYNQYVVHGAGWGFKIVRMLALHHNTSCLCIHTTSPDLPAPTLRHSPLAYLKYHTARITGARIPFLNFGYTPADFAIPEPQQHTSFCDSGLATPYIQRPQTTSHSLCDSPVGLLACVLDALHSASNTYTWTSTEILNWTMMHWLPGPEAGLRWLRQAEREAREGCWTSWSPVPLGISAFRRVEEGRTVWSCPPMWAEAVQRLAWVKRRERAAGMPAWDAPDELVVGLREFFREMVRTGGIKFDRLLPEEIV